MRLKKLLAAVCITCIDVSAAQPGSYSPHVGESYPGRLLFGDTHVHSGLSGDAGGGGTRLMPEDAYRFARGELVTSNTGIPVKLGRPLDFMALSDHSDGMGVIIDILEGAPHVLEDPDGK